MLNRIVISQRDSLQQRAERLRAALETIRPDCRRAADYRRTIALYTDMMATIDRHDPNKQGKAA